LRLQRCHEGEGERSPGHCGGAEVLLLMWLFGDRCKAWGKKAGETVKKWKAVVEEVTQSFDDAVLVKFNPVAEKYKTIETEKELFMEKARDQNWEFVRQEEKKNNIVRLAEEEWKNVKEARENSGKGVKNGW
jgi:hypothetical protein